MRNTMHYATGIKSSFSYIAYIWRREKNIDGENWCIPWFYSYKESDAYWWNSLMWGIFSQTWELVDVIVSVPLHILDYSENIIKKQIQVLQTYPLMAADASVVATGIENDIHHIATRDADFSIIPWLNVWRPWISGDLLPYMIMQVHWLIPYSVQKMDKK